ncbi:MAG: outer membrane lipoprotein carrier protein LolA [Acidiferrobacteraceae bacterium]|nr:outer membrane lipoprotein carrier protein LolA [Acidiferrobacteraceae bacterium]|tara:strand:+ start:380 stop:1024 length:645 start_codon:yes stop_codon:yes gene_type:complete
MKPRILPKSVFLVAVVLLLAVSKSGYAATGVESLNRFFSEFRTFRADFSQIVLDPNLLPLEESSGRIWISRPNRFRWDYHPPFAQQIVADGSKIWMYDVELQQVTVRDQDFTLKNTPAALLVGGDDFDSDYLVKDLGRQGSVLWVSLEPRSSDGNFVEVQLGFENSHLRLIQLLDRLDQITRIVMSHVEENPDIANDRFEFDIPPNVDVIRELR